MAKRIKSYKGLLVKATTTRNGASYKYWITTKDNELEWECTVLKRRWRVD